MIILNPNTDMYIHIEAMKYKYHDIITFTVNPSYPNASPANNIENWKRCISFCLCEMYI